jgi:hypothetical protein
LGVGETFDSRFFIKVFVGTFFYCFYFGEAFMAIAGIVSFINRLAAFGRFVHIRRWCKQEIAYPYVRKNRFVAKE